MDKLFWSIWKIIFKKDPTITGATPFKVDTGQTQDNILQRCDRQIAQYKTTEQGIVLSLGKGVLF